MELNKYATLVCSVAFPSLYIMPRKDVVIGVAAQDVQISGSMTGCHVGAYPSSLLTDEGI